jgi:hypothetical protein
MTESEVFDDLRFVARQGSASSGPSATRWRANSRSFHLRKGIRFFS